jgi:hypothetical protein
MQVKKWTFPTQPKFLPNWQSLNFSMLSAGFAPTLIDFKVLDQRIPIRKSLETLAESL